MSAIWSASSSTVIADLVEPGVTAVDQVVQPAGGGHDQLGAGAQGVRLALQREPADDGGAAQPDGAGVRVERGGDLLGQLTGRHQHQGQRSARRARRPAVRDSRGSPKASVLPEPVRPRPSTSRPASESGRVADWIGNGSVMPWAVSSASSAGASPVRAKEGTTVVMRKPSSTRHVSREGAGGGAVTGGPGRG